MSLLPNKELHWPIDWAGVELIAASEGCRLKAYKDIVGAWTLGWGETSGISEGMTWSQEEADRRLCERLTEFAAAARRALTRQASPSEFAAMVSLAYNIGQTAFARSSVVKAHNRGDKVAAARAFHLWNKAGGKMVKGLVLRRAKESALYLAPTAAETMQSASASATPDVSPACEKPLSQSPTFISGLSSLITGGLAFASQASPQISHIAGNLGVSPILIVAATAVVVGVVVITRRWRQRQEGRG
jgi:lysozyme